MIGLADLRALELHLERFRNETRVVVPRDELSSFISDFEWMLFELREQSRARKPVGRPRTQGIEVIT